MLPPSTKEDGIGSILQEEFAKENPHQESKSEEHDQQMHAGEDGDDSGRVVLVPADGAAAGGVTSSRKRSMTTAPCLDTSCSGDLKEDKRQRVLVESAFAAANAKADLAKAGRKAISLVLDQAAGTTKHTTTFKGIDTSRVRLISSATASTNNSPFLNLLPERRTSSAAFVSTTTRYAALRGYQIALQATAAFYRDQQDIARTGGNIIGNKNAGGAGGDSESTLSSISSSEGDHHSSPHGGSLEESVCRQGTRIMTRGNEVIHGGDGVSPSSSSSSFLPLQSSISGTMLQEEGGPTSSFLSSSKATTTYPTQQQEHNPRPSSSSSFSPSAAARVNEGTDVVSDDHDGQGGGEARKLKNTDCNNGTITMTEALAISNTARLVIVANLPYTVVHANAAYSRLSSSSGGDSSSCGSSVSSNATSSSCCRGDSIIGKSLNELVRGFTLTQSEEQVQVLGVRRHEEEGASCGTGIACRMTVGPIFQNQWKQLGTFRVMTVSHFLLEFHKEEIGSTTRRKPAEEPEARAVVVPRTVNSKHHMGVMG